MAQATLRGSIITIPPGAVVQFTKQGFCMDDGLPAPDLGEKLRLVPISRLIPAELIPLYQGIFNLAKNDRFVNSCLQMLTWGLREAGTKGIHANVLTMPAYREILARATPGGDQIFLQFHQSGLAKDRILDAINSLAKINIGGQQYGLADFARPERANALVGQSMANVLRKPINEPIPGDDSDYSMPIPGLAVHAVGAGQLIPTVSLANTTDSTITFDVTNYFAESRRRVQRIALGIPDSISASTSSNDEPGTTELAQQFIKDLGIFLRDKAFDGMKSNKISDLVQKKALSKLGGTVLKSLPGIGNAMQIYSAFQGRDMLTDEPMGCAAQALAIIGCIPGAVAFTKIAGAGVPAAAKALANAAVIEKFVSGVERTTLARDIVGWVTSDTAGAAYKQLLPAGDATDKFVDRLTGGCDGGLQKQIFG